MVTAAWVLVGLAIFLLLYRIWLWYAIKWLDRHDDMDEPDEGYVTPKWVHRPEDSDAPSSTGIVPGGVSYISEPDVARPFTTKGRKGFGRHSK